MNFKKVNYVAFNELKKTEICKTVKFQQCIDSCSCKPSLIVACHPPLVDPKAKESLNTKSDLAFSIWHRPRKG